MKKNNSTVLAIKYRPTDFKDLIGQEYLVETIRRSIQLDKIPNAYIFTGIRGVGKTTTARIVAKMLNCTVFDNDKNPILDQCEQAKSIAEASHPDVLEIDAASNTSVDNAREIIENVKYSPVMGKYKVYIIDEVHMLSKSAFNALLKTLEEPPLHSKFIFATTEISKVPLTILSRCQRFDLRRIKKEAMYEFLKKIILLEKINIDDKAITMIIKASDGSVRDSLSILDQVNIFKANENIEDHDIVNILGFTRRTDIYLIVTQIIHNQMKELLLILQDMHFRGTETNKVIEDLMEVINWSLKVKINPQLINDPFLSEEDKNFILITDELDQGQLNILWQSLIKGYQEIKISPNPHITLEMILLRSSFLIHDSVDEKVSEKKKPKNQVITDKKENMKASIEAVDLKNIKNSTVKLNTQTRIKIHQDFFQFYGNQFSPLMASLILENCEITNFNERNKTLDILSHTQDFPGYKELSTNLKGLFKVTIKETKNITLLQELEEIYKKELISEEMNKEEFKKVLAKFPNAKILDIEVINRSNNDDG